jgi:hypothetical protein
MRVSDSSVGGDAGQFHTTHWTLVMASAHDQGQTGRAALAALCQIYWYPVYAFARRRAHSPPDAQDLTQGIMESEPEDSYEWAAKALGVGVGTVKTLIYRLRKRYMAIVREEVARTVSNAAEIEGEIRALCNALIAGEGRPKP